jgi:hypothetical protein
MRITAFGVKPTRLLSPGRSLSLSIVVGMPLTEWQYLICGKERR